MTPPTPMIFARINVVGLHFYYILSRFSVCCRLHVLKSNESLQVNVRRRMSTTQVDNTTAFSLNSTMAPTETPSQSKRKFIILHAPSSSAPPSSWIDCVWPVFWPALTVIYLIDVNVFHPFHLVNQALFFIGRIFM